MRSILGLAAGVVLLAGLAGCVEPGDPYAYDAYGRPYASGYGYSRYDYGPPAQWNYRDNSWNASRWDSHPYDAYNRYYYNR